MIIHLYTALPFHDGHFVVSSAFSSQQPDSGTSASTQHLLADQVLYIAIAKLNPLLAPFPGRPTRFSLATCLSTGTPSHGIKLSFASSGKLPRPPKRNWKISYIGRGLAFGSFALAPLAGSDIRYQSFAADMGQSGATAISAQLHTLSAIGLTDQSRFLPSLHSHLKMSPSSSRQFTIILRN